MSHAELLRLCLATRAQIDAKGLYTREIPGDVVKFEVLHVELGRLIEVSFSGLGFFPMEIHVDPLSSGVTPYIRYDPVVAACTVAEIFETGKPAS